jgi:hypothetical protein
VRRIGFTALLFARNFEPSPRYFAMIVFWGERLYGKVDQIPGLFYVGTKFFYFQFIPLFPVRSYLVFVGHEDRGVPIGLSWKSVLFAYLRVIFVLIAALAAGIALVVFLKVGKHQDPWRVGGVPAGLSVLLILLTLLSYRLSRAGALRALKLAAQANISPEVLAQYFIDSPELDRLEDMRAQQWEEGKPSTDDTGH